MKKIILLSVFLVFSGILCGCAANRITPAPGAPEQSVQQYVQQHWQAIAAPHPVPCETRWRRTKEESEKEFGEYRNIFKKYAPYILDEYAAIDQALNWRSGTALRLSFFGRDEKAALKQKKQGSGHECTSWAVLPDKAADNQLLLHKNRDTGIKKSVIVHRMHPGKYAYIGLCDIGLLDITMGMNSVGLAITMNSGDRSDVRSNPSGLDTTQIGRILLENCSTAGEAVALLERMIKDRAYNHGTDGSIWMIADKDCVYTVEHDALRFAYQQTVSGCAVRANTWILPEMLPYSRKSAKGSANSRWRERAVLNTLFDYGKQHSRPVTPEIMAQAARITLIPEAKEQLPPCARHTVSGATFSIDREFPADLSIVYAAAGHPDHTFFIPVPVTVDELPAELLDQTHSQKVYQRQAAKKKALPDRKRTEIEARLNARCRAAREKARQLLKRDFSTENRLKARKIMNRAFKENWQTIQENL